MKELSILIPAYNEGRNIPLLLGDLAEQKLDSAYSVEIIVIVNGSNDATYSIAEQFQDKLKPKGYSVKTVNLAEPGKANASNNGLLMAKYSLIANIDSDCRILDKDFLSKKTQSSRKGKQLKASRSTRYAVFGQYGTMLEPYTTLPQALLLGISIKQLCVYPSTGILVTK